MPDADTTPTAAVPAPAARAAPPAGLGRKAGLLALVPLAMLGLAYASVPLYDLFCRVTGFGGTPLVATENRNAAGDRRMTVRLDTNVAPGFPVQFTAEVPRIAPRLGETVTVLYRVTNLSSAPVTGMATFNVQPNLAASYFNKLQCFCFEEKTLKARETAEFEVVFFVDPAVAKDVDIQRLAAMTLSYTFFPAKTQAKPSAAAPAPAGEPSRRS